MYVAYYIAIVLLLIFAIEMYILNMQNKDNIYKYTDF